MDKTEPALMNCSECEKEPDLIEMRNCDGTGQPVPVCAGDQWDFVPCCPRKWLGENPGLLATWNYFKGFLRNHLPCDGGIDSQPKRLMDALYIIDAEYNRIQAVERKKELEGLTHGR